MPEKCGGQPRCTSLITLLLLVGSAASGGFHLVRPAVAVAAQTGGQVENLSSY